jgi:hypothetical protein
MRYSYKEDEMRPIIPVVLSLILLIGTALAGDTNNTFKSVTVGFEVTKPQSWRFITAEQNLENLKRTKLSDEEFQRMMLKYATAPLVAMMKYPEPFDDLNPSYKVNVKPFGRLKGTDPKQILAMVSYKYQMAAHFLRRLNYGSYPGGIISL